MEMPELNEDILEGESNPEMLNQAENSGSLDESALQPDDQMPMDVDTSHEKSDEIVAEEKLKDHPEESEDTLDDSELQKPNEELKNGDSQEQVLPEITEEKEEEEDEPATKKVKLDDTEKMIAAELEGSEQEESKQDPEPEAEPGPEAEPEAEPEPEPEPEPELEAPPQPAADTKPETQPEGGESQDAIDVKKEEEEEEEKMDGVTIKEDEKSAGGPDTDMLATLASAALEQDPKDKTATVAAAPKSPVPKSETETPKKKPEMWCNVGVFDTNTTIVSDYLATPEPNEHVDLVTATLGGRRIQLEPGTAYKFRVCAVNGCGTGPWSDVAAFKTTLPGFPGAPSAIKISKSPEGAHLTWEPPGGNSSEILEYAVYLAVRSASQGCQPVTTNQAQLAFVRVFCGPTNKCMVGTNSLQAAHIDTTTKPAIIFRIAARNSKGYGPATQVRWLQESQNGTTQGVKRAVKS